MSARWLCLSLLVICLGACPAPQTSQPTATFDNLAPGEVAPAHNGIEFPYKYKNWPVMSVTHRVDKNTTRVVLGNLEATRAARAGNINPWPDGTILASVVWEHGVSRKVPDLTRTGGFLHVEFMFKDLEKYADNGTGWGWARWVGRDLTPYGNGSDFVEECISCHRDASGDDWMFTSPVLLP